MSQNGTFEAFFRVLASCSRTAGIIQMFDSTSIRAHTRRLAQKGQQSHALGGFGTKIHIKCDLDGLPLDFHLTGNEASDSRQFETLLDIGSDVMPIPAAVLGDGLPAVEAASLEALREGVHSADVLLNILVRQREPAAPLIIMTPDAPRLKHVPAADCDRYGTLRRIV